MAIVFQLTLALLLLGSFVACYFCSKVWHWSQVLLAETVFLLGLAFLILAGEVFRIQQVYGKDNKQNLARIEQLEPVVDGLQFGTNNLRVINSLEADEVPVRMMEGSSEDEPGRMLSVRDLDHELGMVTRARGRMWRDASIAGINNGTIALTVPAPDPHGIKAGAILYVFEQGQPAPLNQRGPSYIGEFRVSDVAGQQVQLQPAGEFDERSVQRLSTTQSPWILYENMPLDQYPDGQMEILTDVSAEQLKQLIPPQSVEEYLRQGGPTQPGDDDWNKVGYDQEGNYVPRDAWNGSTQFKYRRSLRDYNLLFQEASKRYTQMEADFNALTADNKKLETALASAKKVQAAHEAEQQKLRTDLAGVTRDREAIEAHRSQVETQLSNAQGLLEEAIQQNTELAKSMN
ncbi:hypothetical protein [Aeoliella mucimassa]|uniref:Uncharacterized protein n=1 Tax=Aeoliella mucimassa TaxID=2527972 RepID=A0A518AIE4_9BACT|nr:hypothetical protein [Aeoliella mucimassa]QDU54486.1 hypothetical protein Pan181_06680 [Aeoliella mucimassa]